AGNADIAVTIAEIMGWKFAGGPGALRGRVLQEALQGAPDPAPPKQQVKASSQAGPGGAKTVLVFQDFGGHTYFDQGCLAKSVAGATPRCE
ncbi:MAG TPA: hypothetical protein VLT16_05035, partial [Candidatus Limnocylindrales bacterium]|nr:hypothetical protein [Candidatus Limnocylindrales bacterium]